MVRFPPPNSHDTFSPPLCEFPTFRANFNTQLEYHALQNYYHWETRGRFRKRVVLANVPSFQFSFRGNMRTYPRSGFRSGGTSERTLVPVFVPGEHPPPFGKPPFCQPPILQTDLSDFRIINRLTDADVKHLGANYGVTDADLA